MKICLNAGHTVSGVGYGAVGFLKESEETRKVVSAVKRYLEMKGHTVIMANVDSAKTQSMYLYQVAKKANDSNAELFVSIHFNAGGGRGCEAYTWRGKETSAAVGVCDELQKIGFNNRGVKDGSGLYVIGATKMNALLVEVCFVDSRLDVDLYKKHGVNVIAQAITRGILKQL